LKYVSLLKTGFFHPDKVVKYLEIEMKKKFRINHRKPPKPSRDCVNYFEKTVYSEKGEDGIIEYIFSVIGTTNKFFVEFGVGDGKVCNTRYLREKGWDGLLMDPKDNNHSFIKKEFVTAENVHNLFEKYRVPKNFDLLSIDVDGNDYYIWKSINNYNPRVVIIEYNSSYPPNESRVIEYDPNFHWDGTDYYGASLLALIKLAEEKGYTLVCCNNKGVNAFFLKDDLLNEKIKKQDFNKLYRFPQYGEFVKGIYRGHPKSNRKMIEI